MASNGPGVITLSFLIPTRWFPLIILLSVNQGLSPAPGSTKPALDAYGGPDAAHPDFTPIQKAISYSMTSPFTTGGIRGSNKNLGGTYHPRSFNMGLSRAVWETIGGYKLSRMGEDIEFAIRIIDNGFRTGLIAGGLHLPQTPDKLWSVFSPASVLWPRPHQHRTLLPGRTKLVHAFPALFTLFVFSVPVWAVISPVLGWLAAGVLALFRLLICIDATRKEKSLTVRSVKCCSCLCAVDWAMGLGFLSKAGNGCGSQEDFARPAATMEYPS